MTARIACLALITIALFSTPTFAQPAATQPASDKPAEKPANFSLTIYSLADPGTFDLQDYAQQARNNPYNRPKPPGYGLVRETRRINLTAGLNTLRFSDVAADIDPTTVNFKSLTDPDSTSVLEQSYEYDLVSSDKLLQKYLNKQILITRKVDTQGKTETLQGTLLSFDGATFVLQSDPGQPLQMIPRNADITAIRLADAQGLIIKPTLVWQIAADKAGAHDAQVTYQTDGLTWRADYNFLINGPETATDISAWVSILNESGASYPQTKLKLVAGDVQRIQPRQRLQESYDLNGGFAAKSMRGAGFTEKAFFEYHLYTLGRPTSLPNKSTKQIELFPTRTNIPVAKTYVYYGLLPQFRVYAYAGNILTDRNLGTESNKKVDVYLKLKNSEKNGLGLPLPAGRIRVSKKDDADNSVEFIGEDLIQHTPKDEDVLVKLGSAFDLVGERKQTNFTIDTNNHVITETIEITVRNHKKEPVTILIKENLYRALNWEITHSTDKWEKQDSRTIHFPIEVPVDGEKKLTYTVRYTW